MLLRSDNKDFTQQKSRYTVIDGYNTIMIINYVQFLYLPHIC